MKYKGELSIIDNAEKAYLLGLIIADGCLFYNKTSGAYQTKIKLKKSDGYLLNKIHKLFPFFTEPRLETRSDKKDSYYIYKYSKELFMDLQKHGVFERKSYENADKVFLTPLSDTLFFDFLRGLFDGDGTITQSKKGHIRIEVIGKNEKLFKEIQERLLTLDIKSSIYYRKDKEYYMLRISNKKYVQKFVENLNTGGKLYLNRKFKPYFNINWERIPGYDNRYKKIDTLFVTWQ